MTSPRRIVRLEALDPSTVRESLRAGAAVSVAPFDGYLFRHAPPEALAALDPCFVFQHRGRKLEGPLDRALRDAGVSSRKTIETLIAEIEHLRRVFVGFSGDSEPTVRLTAVGSPEVLGRSSAGPRTEPAEPLPRLALFHAFRSPGASEPRGPTICPRTLWPAAWGPAARLEDGTVAVIRAASAPCGGGFSWAEKAVARPPGLVLSVSTDRPVPWPERPVPRRLTARRGPAEVVLVSMPFGPLCQPSLGLGLLQATLRERSVEQLYFGLPFAEEIGSALYEWIADCLPFNSARLGEWLFRPTLFPTTERETRRYVDQVLLKGTRAWLADDIDRPSFLNPVPEGLIDELLRVRGGLDGFLERCVEDVLERRPRLVGFTSMFQQHVASLALARRLKARAPEVAVVFGGPNCEGVMGLETCRQFSFLDAVVSGEGEEVFPRIVERCLARLPLEGLTGVYTARSPEVVERWDAPPNARSTACLDDLPSPTFEDYFNQWNDSFLSDTLEPRLLFETSRGCWWGAKQHCTFCGLNGTGMAYRSKTPEHAFEELKELTSTYPGLFVGTADNILDMRYFKTLLPRLVEKDLDLAMFYEIKSNLNREQLALLAAAGVREVQPGIESFSDRVLKLMRKGVGGLQNVQLVKFCQELGIRPVYNLLWGFPGEPPDAYRRMAELLPLLSHLPPPTGMSKIYLERFSPNFDRSAEFGFTGVRPSRAYGHIYPFEAPAVERLAYSFCYRYRDGRDVTTYARPLQEAVTAWRLSHATSRLAMIDRGDHLLICDTRPIASRPLTVLDGLAGELYRACHGTTSLRTLSRGLARRGRDVTPIVIEDALAPLLADHLMIRRGDRLLALALPASLESGRRRLDEATNHEKEDRDNA